MKKLFFAVVAAMALSVSVSAQQQTVAPALSISEGEVGISFRYGYQFAGNWRVAPEFVLFFPDHGTLFNVNANFHYLFNVAPKFNLYPLAGLYIGHFSYDGHSNTNWGLNLGGGAEYEFTSKWAGFAEIKGIISDGSASAFTFGAAYKF